MMSSMYSMYDAQQTKISGLFHLHQNINQKISYNKFIKLQPFIIVFVLVSATAAAFVGTTVPQV